MKSRRRILLVAKILYQETDEDNPISFAEITECLELYGCKPDRKVLYKDIKVICETLFPVRHVTNKGYYAEKGDQHADRK